MWLIVIIYLVTLSHLAQQDFTLSDGTQILKGMAMSVYLSPTHLDKTIYEEPLKFDEFWFVKMKECQHQDRSNAAGDFSLMSSSHVFWSTMTANRGTLRAVSKPKWAQMSHNAHQVCSFIYFHSLFVALICLFTQYIPKWRMPLHSAIASASQERVL